MSRSDTLLRAAADAFDDLRSPFDRDWLVEHDVTLDECGDLSENVATAIRVWLSLTPQQRAYYTVKEAMQALANPGPSS